MINELYIDDELVDDFISYVINYILSTPNYVTDHNCDYSFFSEVFYYSYDKNIKFVNSKKISIFDDKLDSIKETTYSFINFKESGFILTEKSKNI